MLRSCAAPQALMGVDTVHLPALGAAAGGVLPPEHRREERLGPDHVGHEQRGVADVALAHPLGAPAGAEETIQRWSNGSRTTALRP